MNKRGLYTLFRKEVARVTGIWRQTVIAPVITNILFLVIFGVALSEQASSFGEYGYLAVLIPGLIAMGIMTNALQNPMGSLIIAKYSNNIYDILMLPLHGYELALAYISAGLVRGVMVGAATLVAGMFFVSVPFSHPFIILIFTILLGIIFASIGLIIGIVNDDFDKASVIPTFVITPLIYLGGVFYSVSTLPGIFGTISKFNPILYFVDGFRYGFLGVGDAPVWLSLLVTASIAALTFSIAAWMFHTGYKLKS